MCPGWLVTLGAALPNALFMIFPPKSFPSAESDAHSTLDTIMAVFERVGQVGSFAIPFFYRIDVSTTPARVVLGLMAIVLVFYYIGWARYFIKGRKFAMLFAPLIGIPLPMAFAPITYFLLASLVLHSWPLTIAAIVFAVGHIYVAGKDRERVMRME